MPEYFISDIGSSNKIQGSDYLGISKSNVVSSIPVNRPSIYFGLISSPYAIVPTKLEELDYPEGANNIFNHYSGTAGVPLSNIFQKLSASLYLMEPRLLNTSSLRKDSKLLIRRDVKTRLKNIAPFLKFIGDPYLISTTINNNEHGYISDQNLYWIVEGYTSSYNYPYSAGLPGENTNYIRNSVKAIVDAYNGKVYLYVIEPKDPIIKAWQRLFPNLFKPLAKMPQSIKEHLKVPTELFEIKVNQLLRYHVKEPKAFYNGDNIWQVPKETYGKQSVEVEPYHVTAQLKENENSEFLLLQPLAPLARPNLSAWVAARNDGDNYGKLVLLRFPSQTTIYGPEQIQALINQDPLISQQFSLWDRSGSEVIQGNLLVIPLGRSLLYVEPVYLKASKGGLPTLTRIVVSDGKRIAMDKNLTQAINKLLDISTNE